MARAARLKPMLTRLLPILLLLPGATAGVTLRHLPARGASFQEGDLAPLTVQLECSGPDPVALLHAGTGSPLGRPVRFLAPEEARLVTLPDGAIQVQPELEGEGTVLVGSGILLPGERVTFTIVARIPPLPGATPGERHRLRLPLEHSWLPLIPDDRGHLPVLLPRGEARRDQDLTLYPAAPEALEALAGRPPLGRRFLPRPGLTPTPDRSITAAEVQVVVGRAPPAAHEARASGAQVCFLRAHQAWISARGRGLAGGGCPAAAVRECCRGHALREPGSVGARHRGRLRRPVAGAPPEPRGGRGGSPPPGGAGAVAPVDTGDPAAARVARGKPGSRHYRRGARSITTSSTPHSGCRRGVTVIRAPTCMCSSRSKRLRRLSWV
jgi:hypothetical protein